MNVNKKTDKYLPLLLVITMLLTCIGSFGFTVSATSGDDFIPSGPAAYYIMPDKYNTGYIGDKTVLDTYPNLQTKYPGLTYGSDRVTVNTSNITLEGFTFVDKNIYINTGITNVTIKDFKLVGGMIQVQSGASDVTIKNFVIDRKSTQTGSYGYWGINNVAGDRVLIEDGEIFHTSSSSVNTTKGSTIIRRIYTHDNSDDAFKAGSNTLVESCFAEQCGIGNINSHTDGLQVSGNNSPAGFVTSNVKIYGNRFDMPPLPPYQMSTSCLMIKADIGALDDIEAQYNWFNGGSYSVYAVDATTPYRLTNVNYSNNTFGAGGRYGFLSNRVTAGELTWENNDSTAFRDTGIMAANDANPKGNAWASSVFVRNSSGAKVDSLSFADTSAKAVAVLSNYTLVDQTVTIVAEVWQNNVKISGGAGQTVTLNRYKHLNELLIGNSESIYIPAPDNTYITGLINPPAPFDINMEKEVAITLPSNKSGVEVRVYVYKGDGSTKEELRPAQIITQNSSSVGESNVVPSPTPISVAPTMIPGGAPASSITVDGTPHFKDAFQTGVVDSVFSSALSPGWTNYVSNGTGTYIHDPADSSNKVVRLSSSATASKYTLTSTWSNSGLTASGSSVLLRSRMMMQQPLNDAKGVIAAVAFRGLKDGVDWYPRMIELFPNGQIRMLSNGATSTGTDLGVRWIPNEWLSFEAYMEPNTQDVSQGKIIIAIRGNMTDIKGNPVNFVATQAQLSIPNAVAGDASNITRQHITKADFPANSGTNYVLIDDYDISKVSYYNPI